jgi:hypothetical protein
MLANEIRDLALRETFLFIDDTYRIADVSRCVAMSHDDDDFPRVMIEADLHLGMLKFERLSRGRRTLYAILCPDAPAHSTWPIFSIPRFSSDIRCIEMALRFFSQLKHPADPIQPWKYPEFHGNWGKQHYLQS